ncbi:unnamed protein product [Camellia sinensis]
MGQQGLVTDADYRWSSSLASNKSPIFYRMMGSSILQDNKLRLPGKFVRKLGNVFPAVATLTTPNGCAWKVGLKVIDDKVWFTEGWHEFVKHQSIRVGYLLVFIYMGNSNFSVNIYDLGTAEIKYQCNNSEGPSSGNWCSVPYKGGAADDDSVEILNSRSQTPTSLENKAFYETLYQQKLGKSYDHQGIREADSIIEFQAKMNRTGISNSHGSVSDEARGHAAKMFPYVQYTGGNFNGADLKNSHYKANGGNLHVDIGRSVARSTRDIGIQCSNTEFMTTAYENRLHSLNQRHEITRKRKRESGPSKHGSEVQIPGTETSRGTFLRKWKVVTPEEKERVLNTSKLFQSEYPFCRVILRRSYVYKGIGLHMPASFAEKYLGGVSGFITLQVSSGEKWPVRCMWRDGSAKLSKGWPEFVSTNKLEEGDVCVFELIKMGEVVLKVTIFRVAEAAAEPVNQLPKEHLSRTSQFASAYDLNG